MGFIASRRHSGGLGVGMWVHVSHGDGITAAKRLWYCLTKRAYSQFPARSRPTPRTCTRTPEAAQETRAGRHVMYVGDLEPDCCIASRPRVAAFLLRQLQAAWRLAACSGGGVRTKRSLNPIWRYTTSVGARRTDPSRGGPSSSNHLSCFACFTCRPISAIRRQRPRSSLALALILGGRLTRLAVFAPYSPFSQLTLSTPHARHATLTSHHDASPVITPTTTITTTSRPSHSPNIPRAPCPP